MPKTWLARSKVSWSERLAEWVAAQGRDAFLDANVATIQYWLKEHGARIVINIGAFALSRLLAGDRYKNRYELGRIGGPSAKPSQRRQDVDALLGFSPDGRDHYFGAVAVGGTGVRFYGEYCLVLKPDAVKENIEFLDRNSYDLLDPPLDSEDSASVVGALRIAPTDLPIAIATKVMTSTLHNERLLTVGLVAELTLRDEDFIEAHLHRPGLETTRSFSKDDVEEVRQSPEEVTRHEHLCAQQRHGRIPTAAEYLWTTLRTEVERGLDEQGLSSRVVTTNGRGVRWR
jgi:hypothetical protein